MRGWQRCACGVFIGSYVGGNEVSAITDGWTTCGMDSEFGRTTVLAPDETGFGTGGGVSSSRAVLVPTAGKGAGGFVIDSGLTSLVVLERETLVVVTGGAVCSSTSGAALGSAESDFVTAGVLDFGFIDFDSIGLGAGGF